MGLLWLGGSNAAGAVGPAQLLTHSVHILVHAAVFVLVMVVVVCCVESKIQVLHSHNCVIVSHNCVIVSHNCVIVWVFVREVAGINRLSRLGRIIRVPGLRNPWVHGYITWAQGYVIQVPGLL
jgi:hypothetical protein